MVRQDELQAVVESLGGRIIGMETEVKSAKQASDALGCPLRAIIKSLVFVDKQGLPLLVIVDGESRASISKLSTLAGEVKLATPEQVMRFTGYSVGAVPPVGLPIKTIVDRRVMECSRVFGSGGSLSSLCELEPKRIVEYQGATIADIRE
jgi:prolyl-tRNA editing enzyme YbaK/EbsC (Cys-tRNA(Pro) deacylase)